MGLDLRQGPEVKTYSLPDHCLRVSLFAAAVTLPTSTILCNVSLLIAFAFGLVRYIRTKESTVSIALLPVTIFFITVLSILYSQNLKTSFAWFELGTSLLFIPLTFVFGAGVIDKKFRDRLAIAFAAASILWCIVAYVKIAISSGNFIPMTSQTDYTYTDSFSRLAFEEATHMHPSYLSVYLIFSLVIIFSTLKANNFIKAALSVVIFIFLVIMSSKNQLALFFLVISLLLWGHIKAPAKIKTTIVAGVVIVALAAGYFNGQVRHRFMNELTKTLGDRIILWNTGTKIILDHPLLGVGVGDTDDEMNKRLKEEGNSDLINYNMHNQYLDYWMMLGIAGIVSLIAILLIPIFRRVDTSFTFLIVIVGLSMLTESMMYRHRGLVFFLFFYGLFGSDYIIRFKKQMNGNINSGSDSPRAEIS